MKESNVIEVPQESFSRRAEVVPAPVSLFQALTNAALSRPIDEVERLFAMHQSIVKQEAETAFNAAMSRAQAKIVPVATNAENTHTRSRYAKLAAINKAIVPLYTAEGLSITYDTGDAPAGWMRILATVLHSGGHKREYHLDLPLDDSGAKGTVNKTGVQAAGSTSSYGRRYLACMIFNVATEDDNDGNDPVIEGLGEKAVADHLAAIEAASDLDGLKKAFAAGVTAAQAKKDKPSIRKFTEAKDTRKAALTPKGGK